MRSAATDELRDLYEQYGARIHTLARYLLGSRVAAEDAVQSVFLKAFQHREQFRGEADARTWLWRIAVNHCQDELRRRKRVEEVPLDEVLGWANDEQSPELCHRVKQIDEIVARAILQLSPKLRTVVVTDVASEMAGNFREGSRRFRLNDPDDPKAFVVCEILDGDPLRASKPGARVRVCGVSLYDSNPDHRWFEIHPVLKVEVLR